MPDSIPPAQTNSTNTAQNSPTQAHDPRWFWISLGQYTLIFVVTLIFVGVLAYGVWHVEALKDVDTARGLITFLVAVATIAIATLLMMTAMVSGKDFEKRFALGKEVLTLMIGVLGTIIGFYFGAANKPNTGTSEQSSTMQVATPKVSPEPAEIGKSFNLSTAITGGAPPYTYSIKFDPNLVTPPVENEASSDGKINRDFNISGTANAAIPLNFVIEVKDKNNKAFTYNKDSQQKITLKSP